MLLTATARSRANDLVQVKVDELLSSGRELGIQVVAYLDGEPVVDISAGVADPEAGRDVEPDTIFNVFSVTKAVTVTALHLQVERGMLAYDDPVVCYWPEYGANGKKATTVRDIVTHRSGVPQMPSGITPEKMCDWAYMVREIENATPLAPPGTKALYQAMTHGWLIGELVRRSDPTHRSLGCFVREEIARPLGISDLWIGLPDEARPRVAKLFDANPPLDAPRPELFRAATPPEVELIPSVFERPDVRRAEIAAVGGIFNARSCARFWAMLAQGGELDGVRLLSADRVATFAEPRSNSAEPDIVMYGQPMPISIAGFWLGGSQPPVAAPKHARAICHPGAGNSIGWADPTTRLAVAICHNRMLQPRQREGDSVLEIAETLRSALGLD
jgi:CubicO group peptidase (beta-lactamase class C family)